MTSHSDVHVKVNASLNLPSIALGTTNGCMLGNPAVAKELLTLCRFYYVFVFTEKSSWSPTIPDELGDNSQAASSTWTSLADYNNSQDTKANTTMIRYVVT